VLGRENRRICTYIEQIIVCTRMIYVCVRIFICAYWCIYVRVAGAGDIARGRMCSGESKSSFPIALICTTRRRIPARISANHTLYPIPYILYPIPYTLYPIPFTLYPFPIPYTLHSTPYTLYPIPYTPYPMLCTLSRYPLPYTLHRIPYTPYPKRFGWAGAGDIAGGRDEASEWEQNVLL